MVFQLGILEVNSDAALEGGMFCLDFSHHVRIYTLRHSQNQICKHVFLVHRHRKQKAFSCVVKLFFYPLTRPFLLFCTVCIWAKFTNLLHVQMPRHKRFTLATCCVEFSSQTQRSKIQRGFRCCVIVMNVNFALNVGNSSCCVRRDQRKVLNQTSTRVCRVRNQIRYFSSKLQQSKRLDSVPAQSRVIYHQCKLSGFSKKE